jgi:perosamine synthetase
MIVSNNEEYLKKAKHLSTQAKSNELYFTHDEIGYNYRMTNLQAALGLAQLEQLENFIEIKKNNYYFYKNEILKIPGLRILDFKNNIRPNYWFYSLYVEEEYELERDQVISFLNLKKVQTRPIWGLISDQKPYKGAQTHKIFKAKQYIDKVVNIPCSSNLSRDDATYVIECLKKPMLI